MQAKQFAQKIKFCRASKDVNQTLPLSLKKRLQVTNRHVKNRNPKSKQNLNSKTSAQKIKSELHATCVYHSIAN